MIESFREICKYRQLLFMITWRDIRIKYKQSIMGFLWAILMPMIVVSAGLLVRYGVFLLSRQPMVISELSAVAIKSVPWAFFIASVRFSTNSLIGNSNLVTKVYFPKVVFPIASVVSQLFDFAIASCVLIVILIIMGIGLSVHILWVPVLIALLIILAIGLGILLSAANLFFRDVKYLVEVVLTFGIFITPVFYDTAMFGKWANLLLLNPVAPILEGLTSTIIYHRNPQIIWLLYTAIIAAGTSVIALTFFRKLESLFAERI